MTPSWVNDTVRAFGRQMGLENFVLNDRGAAAVRFENGVSLKFEYAGEALVVSAGLSIPGGEAPLKALLAAAHPAARHQVKIRAAYLARSGEAVFASCIQERDVGVSTIEMVFRELWEAARHLGRVLA